MLEFPAVCTFPRPCVFISLTSLSLQGKDAAFHTVTEWYHPSLWVCGQLVLLGEGADFCSGVVTHEMFTVQEMGPTHARAEVSILTFPHQPSHLNLEPRRHPFSLCKVISKQQAPHKPTLTLIKLGGGRNENIKARRVLLAKRKGSVGIRGRTEREKEGHKWPRSSICRW